MERRRFDARTGRFPRRRRRVARWCGYRVAAVRTHTKAWSSGSPTPLKAHSRFGTPSMTRRPVQCWSTNQRAVRGARRAFDTASHRNRQLWSCGSGYRHPRRGRMTRPRVCQPRTRVVLARSQLGAALLRASSVCRATCLPRWRPAWRASTTRRTSCGSPSLPSRWSSSRRRSSSAPCRQQAPRPSMPRPRRLVSAPIAQR